MRGAFLVCKKEFLELSKDKRTLFFTFFLPARTPRPIVDKLSAEIIRLLNSPANKAKIEGMGLQPNFIGGAELDALIKRDSLIWGSVIKAANIQVEQ